MRWKYKVGDKVKVVKKHSVYEYPWVLSMNGAINMVFTISNRTGYDDPCYQLIEANERLGSNFGFSEGCFILCEKPKDFDFCIEFK